MKKIITLILVIFATSIFAADWYSSKELISDLKPAKMSKDTLLLAYGSDPVFGWASPGERATLFNMEDFGMEYPVAIHGFSAFLFDGGDFRYVIYDSDGTTVLFETPDSTSFTGYNNFIFTADSLIIFNDFYLSVLPVNGGTPGIATTNVVTTTHSYVGNPGAWKSLSGSGNLYELIHLIYVSTCDGPDIYPPVIRGDVAGTEPFMNVPANITINVMDKTGAVEPIVGQYSFDGGGSWNDFDLISSKSTITIYGTIPAQADGTTGIVRFNMVDSLGNAGVSDEYPINWSKNNKMLDEDFEEIFPPLGWTLVNNPTGDGFIRKTAFTGALVHSGDATLCHFYSTVDNDDWIITPVLPIPASNSCTLEFWQNGRWMTYAFLHEVAITTDGGTNWTQIYSGLPLADVDPNIGIWEKLSFLLTDYRGQDIQIGFHYDDNGVEADAWYIDDVKVFYDSEGPIVVDIIGNEALRDSVGIGAYLNNDLPISLTAYDLTGIDSIMGHYSYDSGVSWTDLSFAAAKGNELWTATIPMESASIAGIINFDMFDIGGAASTTADYDFYFIGDKDAPDYKYVTGTLAFLNDPMNLTIFFSDESAITSCAGAYSKDNWVSQYDFVLTPSKVHDYTYVGVLPAETVDVLNGEVIFTIGDAAGNFTVTDPETVIWKDGQIEFEEDFETGTDAWYLSGHWDIVEEDEFTSPTFALTESPGGNYVTNENSVANLFTALDWTSYLGAEMSFTCKYDIEHAFDYMYFEVTTNGGTSWTTIKSWDDSGIDWHQEFISLDAFVGTTDFNFRFRFQSDNGTELNGMYIDDIKIVTYNVDYAAPIPIYAPYEPVAYEGAYTDFTNNVDILETTGVDAVEVVWSVDGTPQSNIVATLVSGDQWTFTIPAQAGGSVIEYQFWTKDTSSLANEALQETVYTIIAGEHLIYDNDFVSHYDPIGNGNAIVVKMTVPQSTVPDTTYSADLTHLLYGMYADLTLQSDPMTIRVWQDDGTGQPGTEILIPPIEITPAANELKGPKIEMIDLRDYGLTVYGDFYVGYSSDIGIVYSTSEKPSTSGGVDYGRSYHGMPNGDDTWTWNLTSDNNFNMRAVLGNIATTSIENGNMPLATALEQNYPNPFNPTTTINFTIASEAKVSLVVYDVMGRAVAKLVDGNLSQGSHKVSFDASSMVSGVYYYNLKAGNVNQTKKMILIK